MQFKPLLAFSLALAGCDSSVQPTPPIPPKPAASAPAPPASPPVTMASIVQGSRIVSPMRVTGTAPAEWFGEAVFNVQLIDGTGAVLGEYPARATVETWYEGRVPWEAILAFTVTDDTPATLVMTQDQAGEDSPPPEQVRISVILSPR